MTRARRAALVALLVAAVSAGLAVLLGTSETNIHEVRGLAVAGMYVLATIAVLVVVIALFAALAEVISARR
jgi:uncharacterized membrane protein